MDHTTLALLAGFGRVDGASSLSLSANLKLGLIAELEDSELDRGTRTCGSLRL